MRFGTTRIRAGAFAAALGLTAAAVCGAQEKPAPTPILSQGENLARQLANPVADLVSIPFQMNWDQGVGPNDQTRFVLNVQPVMPFTLNSNWNMITRVIVPLVSQPVLAPGGTATFGVSDVLASAFFAPIKSRVIWGVGPAISLPSTSELTLGTGKWSAGPTLVVLNQAGRLTYGALWNQIWSFAGDSSRSDVSQMFLQPFISYQNANLVTFGVTVESTTNWKAPDHKWTVPVTFSVAKLSSFGTFPASYSIGVGTFVVKPELGPSWRLRAALTVLLPRNR
jgi:hypothetical protein